MKLDAAARRVLDAVVADPDADTAHIAAAAGVQEAVATERLQRLRSQGILLGRSVVLDAGHIGFPYAAFALARPTAQTTRETLENVAHAPGVTRMFTLAAEHSIAFTIIGRSLQDVQKRAAAVASAAGLSDLSVTLLVETLADDVTGGLHRALGAEPLVPA